MIVGGVLLLLLGLIVLRLPIGFAMLLSGVVGLTSMIGLQPALSLVGQTMYSTGFDYAFAVLPLFILMGNLINHAGFAAELYRASHGFLGHYRGGLAMATIVASGGLSAVSGSSLATAATMAKISMPSMRSFGYSDRLSAAAVAAGGTLGILIPPSIVMMLYGILTETDIGKLFIAGVIPGVLGILCYALAVYLVTLRRPKYGPSGPRASGRERLAYVRQVWPVALLFVFIIGGIYAGMFTASEAAGMGVVGSLILGVATGRMHFRSIVGALIESGRTTAMLFFVVIGTLVLGHFANIAGIADQLNNLIRGYDITGISLICLFVVVCLLLGAIVESMSMLLLTIPIFFPIMMSHGFDPIWFGVLFVVVTEISFITPPLGLNLFVLKSTVPDLNMNDLYRGIAPFIIADFGRLALIAGIPSLSLFLPGLMS